MPRVTFLPSGKSGDFEFKTDLLTAAQSVGVFVRTSCEGDGQCGECLIRIEEGGSNLSPILEDEIGAIGRKGLRLACRAKLKGDVVVRTLEPAPSPPEERST